MKKAVMYLIAICIIFSLAAFCAEYLLAQGEGVRQGSTVTISGKVDFPGYKPGQRIRINIRRKPARGAADIASVDIPGPGMYSLAVPRNTGNVYITAIAFDPESKAIAPGQTYAMNPLKVGQSNIEGVDILISAPIPTPKKPQRPYVIVSGKVDFPGYKTGQRIRINAKSKPGRGPTDIAQADLTGPGTYSLEVPRNAGSVYIGAVVFERGNTTPVTGVGFVGIKIKNSDISGVDIKIP